LPKRLAENVSNEQFNLDCRISRGLVFRRSHSDLKGVSILAERPP